MGGKTTLLPSSNQFLIVDVAAGEWGISAENIAGPVAAAADRTPIWARRAAKVFAPALTFGPVNENFLFRDS